MQKRIAWITVAKGICIIAVILGNLGITEIDTVVYAFHLTVFCILSGYTLQKQQLTNTYINTRFIRLLKPYFITVLIIIVTDSINTILHHGSASIWQISSVIMEDLTRAFFASGSIQTFLDYHLHSHIGAIWFLPALFFSNILIQYMLNKVEKPTKRYAISIGLMAISVISANYVWLPFSIQSALFMSFFVLLGYDCKQYQLLSKIKSWHYIVALFIFVLGIYTNQSHVLLVIASMPNYLFSTIVAISGSLVVIKVARLCKRSKILSFIGQHSVLYLCVHVWELETMRHWYQEWVAPFGLPSNIEILVLTIFRLLFISVLVIGVHRLSKLPNEKPIRVSISKMLPSIQSFVLLSILILPFNINESFITLISPWQYYSLFFFVGFAYQKRKGMKKTFLALCKKLSFPWWLILLALAYSLFRNGLIQQPLQTFQTVLFYPNTTFSTLLLLLVTILVFIIWDTIFYMRRYKYPILLVVIALLYSLDIAFLPLDNVSVTLLVFLIGHYCKQQRCLRRLYESRYLYFIISSVFAAIVAWINTGHTITKLNAPLVNIVGTISFILLLFLLCALLHNRRWFVRIRPILTTIGQSLFYTIIISRLFGIEINALIGSYFNSNSLFALLFSVSIQILLGISLHHLYAQYKNRETRLLR